jgi:ATP-dependent exoDNAse (exonuclease V) alpha subunit
MNAAIPECKPATEEISALIERVTFHDDKSGFCVLRVKTPGHRREARVIGALPSVTAGEWLVAEGWWVRDKEHGLQFKASTMKTVPPTTVAGIERYLGSGLVKGIGPVLAKKLVGRFGAEVLTVIETRTAEPRLVDRIGPKRRELIAQTWREQSKSANHVGGKFHSRRPRSRGRSPWWRCDTSNALSFLAQESWGKAPVIPGSGRLLFQSRVDCA